jgi:hypothetical protein
LAPEARPPSFVPSVFPGDDLGAFVERCLEYRLQPGITQELVGQIELGVELPFGTWQWLGQIPFFENIDDAIRSPAPVNPLDLPPDPRHSFYFPFFSSNRRRMASEGNADSPGSGLEDRGSC